MKVRNRRKRFNINGTFWKARAASQPQPAIPAAKHNVGRVICVHVGGFPVKPARVDGKMEATKHIRAILEESLLESAKHL